VDEARSVHLDGGWSAAWLVYGTGDEWPWLLGPDIDHAATDAYPPHELLGPLPDVILERLTRCQAPTPRPDQGTGAA
jgi:hypothetical protein